MKSKAMPEYESEGETNSPKKSQDNKRQVQESVEEVNTQEEIEVSSQA